MAKRGSYGQWNGILVKRDVLPSNKYQLYFDEALRQKSTRPFDSAESLAYEIAEWARNEFSLNDVDTENARSYLRRNLKPHFISDDRP